MPEQKPTEVADVFNLTSASGGIGWESWTNEQKWPGSFSPREVVEVVGGVEVELASSKSSRAKVTS